MTGGTIGGHYVVSMMHNCIRAGQEVILVRRSYVSSRGHQCWDCVEVGSEREILVSESVLEPLRPPLEQLKALSLAARDIFKEIDYQTDVCRCTKTDCSNCSLAFNCGEKCIQGQIKDWNGMYSDAIR